MATIAVPKRVCDRCGANVTENGGRFALSPHEPAGPTALELAESVEGMSDREAGSWMSAHAFSVDLCRGCKGSLLSWWDRASPRRAAAKEGASQ